MITEASAFWWPDAGTNTVLRGRVELHYSGAADREYAVPSERMWRRIVAHPRYTGAPGFASVAPDGRRVQLVPPEQHWRELLDANRVASESSRCTFSRTASPGQPPGLFVGRDSACVTKRYVCTLATRRMVCRMCMAKARLDKAGRG